MQKTKKIARRNGQRCLSNAFGHTVDLQL